MYTLLIPHRYDCSFHLIIGGLRLTTVWPDLPPNRKGIVSSTSPTTALRAAAAPPTPHALLAALARPPSLIRGGGFTVLADTPLGRCALARAVGLRRSRRLSGFTRRSGGRRLSRQLR